MTLTSYAPDGGRRIDLDTTIQNENDVQVAKTVLTEEQLCVGMGMEDQSRDRECYVFMEPEDYVNNVRNQRCTHCQRLRRQMQNLNNRPKVNYKTKHARSQHKLDLDRRKNRRLQEKTEKLKKAIQRTKQQCAAVEDNALMTAMQDFQQCSRRP